MIDRRQALTSLLALPVLGGALLTLHGRRVLSGDAVASGVIYRQAGDSPPTWTFDHYQLNGHDPLSPGDRVYFDHPDLGCPPIDGEVSECESLGIDCIVGQRVVVRAT